MIKTVLLLRTCNAKMQSYGGFKWPKKGPVKAPDWNPDPKKDCGQALHGLLWGEGDGSLLNWSSDAKWIVVKANPKEVVPSSGGGKHRFRRGIVVYCGDREGAIEYLTKHGAKGKAIVFSTATAGDRGTISIQYFDPSKQQYCRVIGSIGKDGLKAGTRYVLDYKHRFIEKDKL